MKALTNTQIQNFNETDATQLYENGELDSLFKTEGFDTRLAKIAAQSPVVFQKLFSGAHTGPALFDLLVNPKLLDIAESLVGLEIMCHPGLTVVKS